MNGTGNPSASKIKEPFVKDNFRRKYQIFSRKEAPCLEKPWQGAGNYFEFKYYEHSNFIETSGFPLEPYSILRYGRRSRQIAVERKHLSCTLDSAFQQQSAGVFFRVVLPDERISPVIRRSNTCKHPKFPYIPMSSRLSPAILMSPAPSSPVTYTSSA